MELSISTRRRLRIGLATMLLACAGPAAVAQTISFGSELASRCTSIGGTGSGMLTMSYPPLPAGRTLLLAVARNLDGAASPIQIAVTGGLVFAADATAPIAAFQLALYSAPVTTPIGAGSLSIAFVRHPVPATLCAKLVEVRGLAAYQAGDQAASLALAAPTALDADIGPVTTTRRRELVVAVGAASEGTWSFLPDPSYTPLASTCTGPVCIAMEYKTIVTTSVQTAGVHLGDRTSLAGVLVTYRDANVQGDFNDDGNADLIFQDPVTGAAKFWLMNGTGRLGGEVPLVPALNPILRLVGADDFTGDHQTDLVLFVSDSREVAFRGMSGTSTTSLHVLTGAEPLPPGARVEATGDLNHDGHPDLLIRDDVTQDIAIWTLGEHGAPWSHRTGVLLPRPGRAVDSNWKIVSVLDYTGDGAPDLLWYNLTTGKIVYWAMDANLVRTTGAFATPPNAGANNWQVVAGGDYGIGADGIAGSNDIVWRNATSGRLVVWHMDPATVSRTSGVFTTPDAPGDPLAFTVVGPR